MPANAALLELGEYLVRGLELTDQIYAFGEMSSGNVAFAWSSRVDLSNTI